MRVLVTGSRDWEDKSVVLLTIAILIGRSSVMPTLIHGACPTGLDHLFDQVWSEGWGRNHIEDYPVTEDEWVTIGKKAGPMRNQKMVNSGADVCLAFPLPKSRGTVDCIKKARAAGIPTFVYGEVDNWGDALRKFVSDWNEKKSREDFARMVGKIYDLPDDLVEELARQANEAKRLHREKYVIAD